MRSANSFKQLPAEAGMSEFRGISKRALRQVQPRANACVARGSALAIAMAGVYATLGVAQAADAPPPPHEVAASAPAPASAPEPAAAASAAAKAPAEYQLQTITVTARRIAEPLQEIPASVSAITGEGLKNMSSLADIQSMVSGVTFKTFGPIPTVGIRGFGNRTQAGVNANSTVGIFQDGVYVAPPLVIDASQIDTERVEVAKGPQSTLYGRASFTGAINIVSNDPEKEFGGYVDVGYGGSSVHSEQLWHARAAVSIPVNDKLSFRLFGLREKRDGYTYDADTGNRGDGYDRDIGRIKALWKPNDDLTARLTVTVISDNLTIGTDHTGRTPAPNGNQVFLANNTSDPNVAPALTFGNNVWDATGNYANKPSGKTKGQEATLDLRYQTRFGELQSLTDLQHATQDLIVPIDLTSLAVARGETLFEEHRWSQELRLSDKIGAVSYQLGAYYLLSRSETAGGNGPDLAHPSIALGPDAAVRQAFPFITDLYTPTNLKTSAHALFGQLGYDFTKDLNLTLGLRRGRDGLSGGTGSYATTVALGTVAQQAMTAQSAGFDSTTGSANLSYKFAPDIVGYASYARGNSPGGFNGGLLANTSYGPQKVDAFEVGMKSQLLNRHLQLNVALFDNQYKDLQITQNELVNKQFASRISNAGDAHGRGVDLDATAILSADWRAGLQYTYAQSELTRYQQAPGTLSVNFIGVPLVRSPKDSINGSLTFRKVVGDGRLSLTAEEAYTSSYTNDYQGTPATQTTPQQLALYRTPGYALTNFNGSYSFGDWTVNGWVRNAFNRQYIASVLAFDTVSYPQELPGEPRTFELSLRYDF